MADPDRSDEEPTTREWIKAIAFVGLIAILMTVALTWFVVTFLAHSCCVTPPLSG